MRIIITESQLNRIIEIVTDGKVICDNCKWSWKLSEGGDDPYKCHKCGHNNSETTTKKKK
jgi:tRNA(Ile2) C34 agmatinyltransferase TiaS